MNVPGAKTVMAAVVSPVFQEKEGFVKLVCASKDTVCPGQMTVSGANMFTSGDVSSTIKNASSKQFASSVKRRTE